MSMSDENAVEFGRFSQPGLAQPAELVGYYEPTQVADLTRQGRLLVVADGVGGAASGVFAGRYAVQKLLHDFYHSREPDLEKRLKAVILQVNQAIFERNRRFPDRRPAAAMLVAALIHDQKLLVARVGDGRAYVVWDRDIEHLTTGEDGAAKNGHNPEKVEADKLKNADEVKPPDTAPTTEPAQSEAVVAPAEKPAPPNPGDDTKPTIPAAAMVLDAPAGSNPAMAATQPLKPLSESISPSPRQPVSPAPGWGSLPRLPISAPYRSLGVAESVEIELFSRRLFPGDAVVLCSGGFTGYVTEAEIAQTVSQNPPDQASRRLAELAVKHSSPDTLAVGVTRILAKPLTQAAPARQPLPLPPDWDSLTRPITKPLPPLPVSVPPPTLKRRWPVYLGLTIVIILFSLVGFLAAASYLSNGETRLEPAAAPSSASVAGAVTPTLNTTPAVGPPTPEQVKVTTQPVVTAPLVAQSNSPISTPTVTATGQVSDVMTPTPTRRPPTPVPTIPLPPDCTNKARFAGDATVEDGTEFAPGESFDKVWSVSNYGTCPWGGGYTIRFVAGDIMGALESLPVAPVEPEATGSISVTMVAPDLPGVYRGTWQLVGQDNQPFGPELYVEIKVEAGAWRIDESRATTLYDFVANAAQAQWSAGEVTYAVTNTPIDRNLVIPDPQGLVALGQAELRGDSLSSGSVLLTHPHLELGYIEGVYPVSPPIQPTDAIIGSLALPKPAAINDDGVTFELAFKPANGDPDRLLFSKLVKYEESPVMVQQPLDSLPVGQSGAFILRVKGGDSLSYDWATWLNLRLVRP
jgi:serine/threonine protein phosphatase PrpC